MKQSIRVLQFVPAVVVVGLSLWPKEVNLVVFTGLWAIWLTMVITSILLAITQLQEQNSLPIIVKAITCIAVIVSVITFHWPLRVVHSFAHPSLERIAQGVRDGRPLTFPARVGLFTIKDVEVRNGVLALWIDLDPSGRVGFVHTGSTNLPFNLWSRIKLDDQWQFIAED